MIAPLAAVAFAALIQTAPANEQIIDDKASEIFELTTRMMFIMGSCNSAFSSAIGQDFKAQAFSQIDQNSEPGRIFLESWDAGSKSPQAASMTLETCAAAMQPIAEEMQRLSEEIQPLLPQD